VLLYLHADPAAWPDGRRVGEEARSSHRAEIAAFASMVADNEVAFRHASYGDWLSGWPAVGVDAAAHALAIRSRFLLA
jgi:hypothetical protein